MSVLFFAHAAATWALVGLIWTVQLVHYPLFAEVGAEHFSAYHARHTRQITWVVAPLMGAELVSAALLFAEGHREPWFLAAGVALALNWLSTWLVQIPLHNRLAAGFDSEAHRRLVKTNWLRTAAWTMRGACLFGVWL
jgi:hypothetical protein